jgi:hypothetical protein
MTGRGSGTVEMGVVEGPVQGLVGRLTGETGHFPGGRMGEVGVIGRLTLAAHIIGGRGTRSERGELGSSRVSGCVSSVTGLG